MKSRFSILPLALALGALVNVLPESGCIGDCGEPTDLVESGLYDVTRAHGQSFEVLEDVEVEVDAEGGTLTLRYLRDGVRYEAVYTEQD